MEEKKIEAFEKRKSREVNRKYNKEIADMRKQAKVQSVKEEKESAKRMRKNNENEDDEEKSFSSGKKSTSSTPTKSKKRVAMVT